MPDASIVSSLSYPSVAAPAYTISPLSLTTIASSLIFSSSISWLFSCLFVYFGSINDFMFLIIVSFIIHSPFALVYRCVSPSLRRPQCHTRHQHVLHHPYPDRLSVNVPGG